MLSGDGSSVPSPVPPRVGTKLLHSPEFGVLASLSGYLSNPGFLSSEEEGVFVGSPLGCR